MAIIAIVAIDRNRAIGKGGTIPWHYSSDLKFFKQQTLGHACVMGRRTWASLKKPLKDRLNIVLSRTGEVEPQPGVLGIRDKESVLTLAKYLNCDLYIIGGEQVYSAFAVEIDRWIVTEVPVEAEDADTFMPEGFLAGFQQVERREIDDGLHVVFYERNKENEGVVTPS
jgi:dihydrofolate reductase